LTTQGLLGLGVAPEFRAIQDNPVSLAHSFRVLEFWYDARLAGFLPAIRRRQVTDGFLATAYERLCGSHWAKAAAAFRADPSSRYAIDNLQRAVGKHGGFAAVLRRDFEKMSNDPESGAQWYAEVAARYRASADRSLCEFALRLASQPHRLPNALGTQLDDLLRQVLIDPTLLRGARLLALLCAHRDPAGSSMLLPRWKW
jgi:hypothetical protein